MLKKVYKNNQIETLGIQSSDGNNMVTKSVPQNDQNVQQNDKFSLESIDVDEVKSLVESRMKSD